jgi:hypothetical protein
MCALFFFALPFFPSRPLSPSPSLPLSLSPSSPLSPLGGATLLSESESLCFCFHVCLQCQKMLDSLQRLELEERSLRVGEIQYLRRL